MKKSVLTIVILLSTLTILLLNLQSQAQCHIEDWTALKALSVSTDGDNWTNNAGWEEITGNAPTANCNLGNLHGVSLNANGRVDRLILHNNELNGNIPSELGNLNNLIFLQLNNNQLTGIIPANLGNLTNLIELFLHDNQLTGNIPAELGNLSNLTKLYLSTNELVGNIPPELRSLSNLTHLYLHTNQLVGNIPAELGSLSNLTHFILYANQLTGIPSELGNLNNLLFLQLNNNQLTGIIPANLGNLTNLIELFLHDNQLSGNIPAELGNLSNLTKLYLSTNELTGNIPPELGSLGNLIHIYLHTNQLSGCYPDSFTSFCGQFTNSGISNGNNFSATWEVFCADGDAACIMSNCHIDDWTALKALYGNTNGDNWTNKTGWEEVTGNTPTANCKLQNLYGVSLDANGRVTQLGLRNNQLSGSIPPELGQLSKLEVLNLIDSELIGNIPPELGQLSNLMVLGFFNSQLIGNIPPELGNLTNLTEMDLRLNQLTGSIPTTFGNLSKLTKLYLNNNQLSGSIPAELGNLNNLIELALGNNELSGSIPPELGNLSNLSKMLLRYNQLSGTIPPELSNLTNLEDLMLADNQLSGSIPIELSNLSNLTRLMLSQNQLSGTIPPELRKLNNLTSLTLYFNQLSGSIPPELGELSNLTFLSLYGNPLTGSIPAELGNLSKLTDLVLHLCQLSGNIPPELGKLSNLTHLMLRYNQFSGNIPPELGNLNKLTSLDLGGNQLNGNIPPQLGKLSNLTRLGLFINQLTGKIPPELGNLNNLTRLKLFNNDLSGCYHFNLNPFCTQLTDEDFEGNRDISEGNNFNATWEEFCSADAAGACVEIPNCHINDWVALKGLYDNTDGNNWTNQTGWEAMISDLSCPPANCNLGDLYGVSLDTSGRVVDLSLISNQLTGIIPSSIKNLTNLTALDLSENQLSGDIPLELSKLINLTELSLSSNLLSGSIPSELSNLSRLVNLRLYENQLSGSIPPELGGLNKLTNLLLHTNLLSGSIPPELGELSNLTSLSLSSNQLSGIIPTELSALNNLTDLVLHNNLLSGNIPPELGELSKLTDLDLGDNQLSGNIPPELGKLSSLTKLGLFINNLSGSIPPELGDLNNLTELLLYSNQLGGSIPLKLENLTSLTSLFLFDNELNGSIPPELGNLANLTHLSLQKNQFSGNIPPELGTLTNLTHLSLQNNKLKGNIPPALSTLTNLTDLDLSSNYYNCQDIENAFYLNSQIQDFIYSPQYYTPSNYNDINSNVFDSITINHQIIVMFPFDTSGVTYQWFRNGAAIPFANQATLKLDTIQPGTVGKYTLELSSDSCLPNNDIFTAVSEPIYVILKGYNLLGQPIEYTQLMVEFENETAKKRYEQEIFFDNGGVWKDKCDCNRELHLYDFPKDSSSIEQAYIALDKKIASLKSSNEIDGGINYKLNNIGLNFLSAQATSYTPPPQNEQSESSDNTAYNVTCNYPAGEYNNPVQVYLLDSGLDESNSNAPSDFLLYNAPVDSCYTISAPGYNFTKEFRNLKEHHVTIDTGYQDRVGHGTFGFRSIGQGLEEAANAKIVPLKIIEKATEGNLFDLICAMYHAVDHNADVINISAGYQGEPSGILANAIYLAKEKGIFIVAAAGNDNANIDDENEVPQYPAYFSSQYHYYYEADGLGQPKLDSVPYDNLISVAAINFDNVLNEHSNYGAQSVTIAAPGEKIYGYGLEGADAIGTGTSFAAFLTTQVLAREIARLDNRSLQQIWTDFENQYLVENPSIAGTTSTGKQINFVWEVPTISGCTDCEACNYFPSATIDDGSCYYYIDDPDEIIPLTCPQGDYCPPCPPLAGCTDVDACNYLPTATINDGSCLYEDCSEGIEIVVCPEQKDFNICAPVSEPPPLSLQDFSTTGDVTLLSAHSLQVIQKTDVYKYYSTTTYNYIITDGAGNKNTCQSKYHIANQFLQAPEINYQPVVCQDELWSHLKLGAEEYKIYSNNNGSIGEELAVCNTQGLHCSTSNLAVNTAIPGTRQFWVSQYFDFPNGEICESEATSFQVEIQPKPIATLTVQNISLNIGEGIFLMDVVTNNTSGYWSGENIIHLMTTNGENIPYFSANATKVYKLYYTVKNGYCEQSYLLIVQVVGTLFANKELMGFAKDGYRINEAGLHNEFSIYPNPSSGKVFIELNYNSKYATTLSVFDIAGKIIYQNLFEGKYTTIDFSDLAKGIYMVEVQNTNYNTIDTYKSIQKLLIE